MRDRRFTKIARDIWLHRSRSLLAIAAIVVGIVGAGAVLDAWSLLRRVTRDGYLATNPAAATLRLDRVDSALLATVRAMPAIRGASARRTVVGSVRTADGWRTALLFAGADLRASDVGRIDSVGGAWIPADASIVVENSSVEFSGLLAGDTVALRLADGAPSMLPVAGIARDAGLAPGWMEHTVYLFVSAEALERLGAPAGFNELRITTRGDAFDREANRRVALDVKRVAEQAGYLVSDVDVPLPGRHIHAGQMDSLLFTQAAFGLLSLLLSAFLVVNLISAMLTGQTREIGMMKAIGAAPGQIAAMYLTFALTLGAAASLIALPVAALIGRKYAEFSASLLNFDVAEYRIPWWAYASQLAVGLLMPVLAAAVPVWRGVRISVSDAFRDVGESSSRTASRGYMRALPQYRPLLLSLRNAFRKRQRMALTLLSLSLAGAVYLGALGLRSSIRSSVDVLYGEIMRFDIVVRFSDSYAAADIERIARDVEGVRAAEAWGGMRAAVDHADGMLAPSFPVTGLSPDSKLVAFPLLDGQWLTAEGTGVLVVNKTLLASDSSLQSGRLISLVINGKAGRWRVAGVVESGPAPNAYVTREALARALGTPVVRTVVVGATAQGTAAHSELAARLRTAFDERGMNVANVQLVQANRASIEDHLLMVAGFLLVMSQLALVVGGLGLASTMSLAVLERTREIGVLRAVGASHRAIFVMVQVEALVVALASWLVAIPLSIPVSVLLGEAFGRIMMPVPLRLLPDAGGVAIWFAVAVLISLLATALPARRATRVPTATALAYE